jgi:hypothetical protein
VRFLAVLCFGFTLAIPLQAATIRGRVVDQRTGEALRKVRVTVRDPERTAISDDDGRFLIEGLPAGKYMVSVSTIGYRLIRREVTVEEDTDQDLEVQLGQEAATISEMVSVTAPVFEEVEKAAVSQTTLNNTEIKNLAGVLIDDPLRSVQTLPGVAAGDDFQSYYSVRGGAFQNNGLVVDGVFTHSLVHTIQGTTEPTGSVTILNGDLVESMALYSGAFAAKYGDSTASFLDVVTREGSRDRNHTRAAVSGTNAGLVAEGPLDSRRRGSWIFSARKSYADYLIRRLGTESDLGLGFGDVQGRITQDVSSRHRLGAGFVWGRAVLSRDPANRGVTSLIDGRNDAAVANLFWTFSPDTRTYIETRLYHTRENFLNRNRNDEMLDDGRYRELALRSDLSRQAGPSHRLEGGVLVRSLESRVVDRRYSFSLQRFLDYENAGERYRQTAGYLQDRWNLPGNRLSAIVGVRYETTALTGQSVWNPRASLVLRLTRSQKLEAGWGVFNQFPEMLPVFGRNGDPRLRAETSRHYVAAYEFLAGEKTRVRFEAYDKEESNLVRSRDSLFRLVNGRVAAPDVDFTYDNALRGFDRGVEVTVQRRSANRLAGWISYALSKSRRHDLVTGEWYDSEFEQRHTVNVYASYRLSESWNFSAKARYGSGFPYPQYFELRGTEFYLSSDRNRERLPFYGRFDLRLNRAFYYRSRKLSLYFEVLNVFDRENIRFDQVSGVNSTTRRVSYSRDTLFPILPTAGFTLEF